jgi:alpha-glucoside transport system permease protein
MTGSLSMRAPTTMTHRRYRSRASWSRILLRLPLHTVVIVLVVVWFTPILALLVSSFRPQAEILTTGWWHFFLAPHITSSNYSQAASEIGLRASATTSLLMAVPVTVMTVLLSALAAYALARMRFRGRTAIFLLLVGLLVIPPQVTLVPVLRMYNSLGLTGSIASVWIYQVGFTVPFGVFLLRGFFAAIPAELTEAAEIDGASPFRTFISIVVPTAAPALASLAILQFLWSWNDLLIPLLFLGGSGTPAPITVQAAGLAQSTGAGDNTIMAATFMSVALPLAILIALQRYFVRGILGGAIKG